MYEIRYRVFNSNGPYNMTNTTNTQYSIKGSLPSTNYIIGVRAYTSAGPGEWRDIQFSNINICKSCSLSVSDMYILFLIAMVSGFSIIKLNGTAVYAMWQPVITPEIKHYTIYYISTKRQFDMGNRTFPAGRNKGVIGGLQDNLNYLFSLSVTYEINGVDYEGEKNAFISFGMN